MRNGFFLFALWFCTFLISPLARAAVINVTTTSDEIKIGDCSLREAIIAANTDTATTGCSAGSGSDEIKIPAGTYTLYIGGMGEDAAATGDLDITGNLTLTGASATTTIINGNGVDRVLHLQSSANVTITNLQITGGNSTDNGGGIYINTSATVTLNSSTISGNSAGHDGGGIYAYTSATVTLSSSTISGNSAGDNGGGIYTYSSAMVTLNTSTISGNTTTYGGGIMTNSSTVTLGDSTISGNTTTYGGGIMANSSTVTLNTSTISGNMADSYGGGILVISSTVTLGNSTISGNTADTLYGGGIYAHSSTMGLYNLTLAYNDAKYGGGIYIDGGNISVRNTLIASNTARSRNPDCYGTIAYLSYSLMTDTTGCTITSGTPIAGPAYLDVLANYGGPTQTHKLKPTSPAIDAGDTNGCKNYSGRTFSKDQRGRSRTYDGDGNGTAVCDMGAYEKSS